MLDGAEEQRLVLPQGNDGSSGRGGDTMQREQSSSRSTTSNELSPFVKQTNTYDEGILDESDDKGRTNDIDQFEDEDVYAEELDDDDDDEDDDHDMEMILDPTSDLGILSPAALRQKKIRKRRRVRNKRSSTTATIGVDVNETKLEVCAQSSLKTSKKVESTVNSVADISSNTSTISNISTSTGSKSNQPHHVSKSKGTNQQHNMDPSTSNPKSKKPHDAPMTKSDLYYAIRCGVVQAEIAVVMTIPSSTNPETTTIMIVQEVLGRVTLVNWDNKVVYDAFITPQLSGSQQQQIMLQEPIVSYTNSCSPQIEQTIEFRINRILDYRTAQTGITAHHFDADKKSAGKEDFNLLTMEAAKPIIKKHIKGKILIGYNVPSDLQMIHDGITHPKRDVRDIAQFAPYMNTIVTARPMSLSVSQDKQQIVHFESVPLPLLLEKYPNVTTKNNSPKRDYGVLFYEAIGCLHLYKRLRTEWEEELCRLSRHKYNYSILPSKKESSTVPFDQIQPPSQGVTPIIVSHQQHHYISPVQQLSSAQHQYNHPQHQQTYVSTSNQPMYHGSANLSKTPPVSGSLSISAQQLSQHNHRSHTMTISQSAAISYPPITTTNEGQLYHPIHSQPRNQSWSSIRSNPQFHALDHSMQDVGLQEPPLSIPDSRYYNQKQQLHQTMINQPTNGALTTVRTPQFLTQNNAFSTMNYTKTSPMKRQEQQQLLQHRHHQEQNAMSCTPQYSTEAHWHSDAGGHQHQSQFSQSTYVDPWSSQPPTSNHSQTNMMSKSDNSMTAVDGSSKSNTYSNILLHERASSVSIDQNITTPMSDTNLAFFADPSVPDTSTSWSPLLNDNFSLSTLLEAIQKQK